MMGSGLGLTLFTLFTLFTATKKRVFKRIKENPKLETVNSYIGLVSHGNSYKIKRKLLKEIAF